VAADKPLKTGCIGKFFHAPLWTSIGFHSPGLLHAKQPETSKRLLVVAAVDSVAPEVSFNRWATVLLAVQLFDVQI